MTIDLDYSRSFSESAEYLTNSGERFLILFVVEIKRLNSVQKIVLVLSTDMLIICPSLDIHRFMFIICLRLDIHRYMFIISVFTHIDIHKHKYS